MEETDLETCNTHRAAFGLDEIDPDDRYHECKPEPCYKGCPLIAIYNINPDEIK